MPLALNCSFSNKAKGWRHSTGRNDKSYPVLYIPRTVKVYWIFSSSKFFFIQYLVVLPSEKFLYASLKEKYTSS